MSEFPSYDEQVVLNFSVAKIDIVYKEALRNRASKYAMLSQLINLGDLKDDRQKEVRDHTTQLLNPHFITEHTTNASVADAGWAALRRGI